MKEIDTEIVSKIQKLLNLANTDKNNNIGETTTAMEMAHKLLRKYQISMSQVMEFDSQGNIDTNFLELKECEAVRYAANVLPKWIELIIKSVNRITQTKTLIKRSARENSSYGNLSIVFIGDSVDVDTSIKLFDYLKDIVSKLSTEHSKQNGGKFKYWRSFAEGCSTNILDRSEEIDKKLDSNIGSFSLSNIDRLSVENREMDDDEEYEVYDEDIEEQLESENFSVELYNKYKESKIDKIREYINNAQAENEESSSRTARMEMESFEQGQIAGEKIPLKVSSKLTRSKK